MELASGQDQLTSEGIYTVEKIRQILAETISSSAKSAGNAWFGFACVTVKINPLLCRGREDL